jgi:hypothetical protein
MTKTNRAVLQKLVDKWTLRILGDEGWVITVDEDLEIEEPATAIVVTERFVYREASIKFRPNIQPCNKLVCHEVCHVALAAMAWSAKNAFEEMANTVEAQLLAEGWLQQGEEETTEMLTRAFLAAYGEE